MVAIARYEHGACVASVFTLDRQLPAAERFRKSNDIFTNMHVRRTVSAPETRFGELTGRIVAITWMIDLAGGCYVICDIDGDNKPDSYTTAELWLELRDADDSYVPLCYTNNGGGGGGGVDLGSDWSGSYIPSGSDLPFVMPGGGGGTSVNPGSGSGDGSNPGDDVVVVKPRPNPLPNIDDDILIIPLPVVGRPCFDNSADEANPLVDMDISKDNRSWKSNTWGYVRVDKKHQPKFHDGVDLVGVPGETPVFAMYAGVVLKVVYWQPNRNEDGEYPPGYDKDNNDAGNRIIIVSKLSDGRRIHVCYWHLDVEANNPYTKTFKSGDRVEQGQQIGIVGKTGNAYNCNPHLHVKTYIEGTTRDDPQNNPFLYLYTKFEASSGKIFRDCQ